MNSLISQFRQLIPQGGYVLPCALDYGLCFAVALVREGAEEEPTGNLIVPAPGFVISSNYKFCFYGQLLSSQS